MKQLAIWFLCACSSLSYAASASDDLQAKLNSFDSMSADFNQVVKAGAREISRSKGAMAIHRPRRFRWQTKQPIEQLVVADGNSLWIYDVDLEQVTVKKQENSLTGTPALFLSRGKDTLTRDFNVISLNSSNNAHKADMAYDLHAKSSKENYQHVILRFQGNALTKIEFYDQLGQHTLINLSKVKTNPQLASSLFQFKPPKGVDVVKQ